jgi:hypothetical protein
MQIWKTLARWQQSNKKRKKCFSQFFLSLEFFFHTPEIGKLVTSVIFLLDSCAMILTQKQLGSVATA